VIITTCTSNLGTVERVTRLLFHSTTFVPVIHSLTERSSEGQPAHTASGEDGTTGKDRLAKTPQVRSVLNLMFFFITCICSNWDKDKLICCFILQLYYMHCM